MKLPLGGVKNANIQKKDQTHIFRIAFMVLSFLAPFEMMLLVFARNIIYPFGDQCFLGSDLFHQYMPFFHEFLSKIKAGESLSYTWNIGVGSNFTAIYWYNVASPFYWLAYFFPEAFFVEFIGYLVTIKIGLAGLGAFLYFDSHSNRKDLRGSFFAMVFSCFYAMSGYVAAYNLNIMWLDGIALTPIILWGLERMVKQGKMKVYVISLAVCILSNFYFAIFVCAFVVLYFIALYFTERRNKKILWQFAAASLLAGGISAAMIFPMLNALLGTEFQTTKFTGAWKTYFSLLDVLSRHCWNVKFEELYSHWPSLYCGSGILIFIPLYALNGKISRKKKIAMFSLLFFFLLSFQWNGLDYLWHGFNFPHGFPARQAFLYILLVLTACHECLTNFDGITKKSLMISYAVACVVIFAVGVFVKVPGEKSWNCLWTLLFMSIYAICTYLYYVKSANGRFRDNVATLCYVLVLAECTINMSLTSVMTIDREPYLKNVTDVKTLYERNRPKEGFQRFENFSRSNENDSALSGFPSASIFSSLFNSNVKDFYDSFGMRYGKAYYRYDGATAFSAALINVGYAFSKTGNAMTELYSLKDQESNVCLLQANYQLPFGYVAPYLYDFEKNPDDDAILLQNVLVQKLGIDEKLFWQMESQEVGQDTCFTPEKDGIYYGVTLNDLTTHINLISEAGWKKSFQMLKENDVLSLGKLTKGENVRFTDGNQDEKQKVSVAVYYMDLETLEKAIQKLSESHLTQVKVNNDKVSGYLKLDAPGRLITTVPCEKGWTVRVNGEKQEFQTFGGAFIALDLEPGEYKIEMDFVPAGRNLGAIISVICILVFAGWEWMRNRKLKQKS